MISPLGREYRCPVHHTIDAESRSTFAVVPVSSGAGRNVACNAALGSIVDAFGHGRSRIGFDQTLAQSARDEAAFGGPGLGSPNSVGPARAKQLAR